MNQGPLPGMGGLPRPLHDTADARINYNSTLLGDLEPYAYGKPGYLSSQTSYLNIPHRIQKIVPPLWLPEPASDASFKLSHPVDEGDISFVMRLNRNSEVCSGLSNKSVKRAGFETAVDPFINLCTLNYILAGLQISAHVDSARGKWDKLMHHLDAKRFKGDKSQKYGLDDLFHVVEHLIRPFGIVHGKDKQGGQSEMDMSSVQWPVSFVTSMVLDGKDSDIVNIWHFHDINAGDDLVLRMKIMPLPPGNKYTLNHYRDGVIEKTFPVGLLEQASESANKGHAITHVWQLVPDIFSFDLQDELNSANSFVEYLATCAACINKRFIDKQLFIPWQHHGYWHIARTQVHSKIYGYSEYYYNDMALNLRLGHIESTFQPDYCTLKYDRDAIASSLKKASDSVEEILKDNDESLHKWTEGLRRFKDALPDKSKSTETGASSLLGTNKKRPSSTLHLQSLMDQSDTPEPTKKRHVDNLRSAVHPSILAELNGTSRASRPLPESVRSTHSSADTTRSSVQPEAVQESSALMEDIGVFDEPGPVPPRVHFEEQVPTFTVPKPSLKAKKPAKGKGVVSSVLGADGSIRQEQSRML